VRSAVVNVIDLRYWWYTANGGLYAPAGGQNLAPRQQLREARGGTKQSEAATARMVREYRRRCPDKAVLCSLDGRPSGYALYRLRPQFEAGNSVGDLRVIEAIGATPEATREIWRFVLDVDWVARVKAFLLPVDHPLFFLLARPREMNFRVHDGLWIRLVDLPAAFAARCMGDAAPVVIEVTDAFCPWNAGRWQISGAGAERTSADAELDCDITSLGLVYLGGFSFRRLVRAGRVMELCEGAAERADTLFPADLAPWCPEIF